MFLWLSSILLLPLMFTTVDPIQTTGFDNEILHW